MTESELFLVRATQSYIACFLNANKVEKPLDAQDRITYRTFLSMNLPRLSNDTLYKVLRHEGAVQGDPGTKANMWYRQYASDLIFNAIRIRREAELTTKKPMEPLFWNAERIHEILVIASKNKMSTDPRHPFPSKESTNELVHLFAICVKEDIRSWNFLPRKAHYLDCSPDDWELMSHFIYSIATLCHEMNIPLPAQQVEFMVEQCNHLSNYFETNIHVVRKQNEFLTQANNASTPLGQIYHASQPKIEEKPKAKLLFTYQTKPEKTTPKTPLDLLNDIAQNRMGLILPSLKMNLGESKTDDAHRTQSEPSEMFTAIVQIDPDNLNTDIPTALMSAVWEQGDYCIDPLASVLSRPQARNRYRFNASRSKESRQAETRGCGIGCSIS